MARGEVIAAISMTEPSTGSDLQAVRTYAQEDGDDLIINGTKIFITNGYNCDMAIVVCKTGDRDGGANSIRLVIIEADRPGFSTAKPLTKMGRKAQNDRELFLVNVRVLTTKLI